MVDFLRIALIVCIWSLYTAAGDGADTMDIQEIVRTTESGEGQQTATPPTNDVDAEKPAQRQIENENNTEQMAHAQTPLETKRPHKLSAFPRTRDLQELADVQTSLAQPDAENEYNTVTLIDAQWHINENDSNAHIKETEQLEKETPTAQTTVDIKVEIPTQLEQHTTAQTSTAHTQIEETKAIVAHEPTKEECAKAWPFAKTPIRADAVAQAQVKDENATVQTSGKEMAPVHTSGAQAQTEEGNAMAKQDKKDNGSGGSPTPTSVATPTSNCSHTSDRNVSDDDMNTEMDHVIALASYVIKLLLNPVETIMEEMAQAMTKLADDPIGMALSFYQHAVRSISILAHLLNRHNYITMIYRTLELVKMLALM